MTYKCVCNTVSRDPIAGIYECLLQADIVVFEALVGFTKVVVSLSNTNVFDVYRVVNKF